MEWWWFLILILGSLMFSLTLGLPVALAFWLVNVIWVFVLWGGTHGLDQLILSMYQSVASFILMPIPFFILMGEVLFRSGTAMEGIDVLDKWLGAIPGRLCLLAVIIGVILAALSGSAVATTALLGSVLMPEMLKRGYHKSMVVGSILSSAAISIIIPPSNISILLAALGGMSVAKILIGGTVPGLIMGFFYALYIIIRSWTNPSLAPSYTIAPTTFSVKVREGAKCVLPIVLIIFLVTGLIFLGVGTPSEAAAAGALGAFIIAAIKKKLNWQLVKESVLGTTKIAVMFLMIITGAAAYSQILSFSGAGRGIVEFALGLGVTPIAFMIISQIVLIILGTALDPAAMLMISLPIFMPVVNALKIDPIWFGVIIQ